MLDCNVLFMLITTQTNNILQLKLEICSLFKQLQRIVNLAERVAFIKLFLMCLFWRYAIKVYFADHLASLHERLFTEVS